MEQTAQDGQAREAREEEEEAATPSSHEPCMLPCLRVSVAVVVVRCRCRLSVAVVVVRACCLSRELCRNAGLSACKMYSCMSTVSDAGTCDAPSLQIFWNALTCKEKVTLPPTTLR